MFYFRFLLFANSVLGAIGDIVDGCVCLLTMTLFYPNLGMKFRVMMTKIILKQRSKNETTKI